MKNKINLLYLLILFLFYLNWTTIDAKCAIIDCFFLSLHMRVYIQEKKISPIFLPLTYRCVALTKWVEFGKTKKRTHSIFVHAFVWGDIFFPLLSTFICIVHIRSVKKIKSIKLLHICKKMTSFFFRLFRFPNIVHSRLDRVFSRVINSTFRRCFMFIWKKFTAEIASLNPKNCKMV